MKEYKTVENRVLQNHFKMVLRLALHLIVKRAYHSLLYLALFTNDLKKLKFNSDWAVPLVTFLIPLTHQPNLVPRKLK